MAQLEGNLAAVLSGFKAERGNMKVNTASLISKASRLAPSGSQGKFLLRGSTHVIQSSPAWTHPLIRMLALQAWLSHDASLWQLIAAEARHWMEAELEASVSFRVNRKAFSSLLTMAFH